MGARSSPFPGNKTGHLQLVLVRRPGELLLPGVTLLLGALGCFGGDDYRIGEDEAGGAGASGASALAGAAGSAGAGTCRNGVLDGSESDADCGGDCPGCPDGRSCAEPDDCTSGFCSLGSCQTCGVALSPTGGPCPSECTGGCTDNVCTFLCDEKDECKDGSADCPAGFACDVRCTGDSACEALVVMCPPLSECRVACDSSNACKGAVLECSGGPCSVTCGGPNPNACDDMVVNCGSQECRASCEAEFRRPSLRCGSSCDCSIR
jgi:hypothetical protein